MVFASLLRPRIRARMCAAMFYVLAACCCPSFIPAWLLLLLLCWFTSYICYAPKNTLIQKKKEELTMRRNVVCVRARAFD